MYHANIQIIGEIEFEIYRNTMYSTFFYKSKGTSKYSLLKT